MRNLLIAGAAVVAAAVLFVMLRPDDGDESSATPGTTTVGTEPPATTEREPQVPPPPRPLGPARVRVVVRNAQPVGGVRSVTVARGRRVILYVSSNLSDHVHLHGYDVMRDVGPGRPATISFRATIVGTVDAELEDRRVQIASITTKP